MAVPGTFHNFKRPACQGPDPLDQLSAIACIGPDQSQMGKPPYHFVYDQLRSISVLNISRMHHHGQQQPYGIHYDVSLSTVDLLAGIIATRPPFSVVFTDWLSMMAALGVGLLPSASRTAGRRQEAQRLPHGVLSNRCVHGLSRYKLRSTLSLCSIACLDIRQRP